MEDCTSGGATAPGTPQLRALGCTTALVIPMSRAADILKQIAPDAADSLEKVPGRGIMVMCQVRADDRAIACGDVARTYASAVPDAPQQFAVSVQGRGKARYQGTFNGDGTPAAPPAADTRLER